ncbi:MAG: hypothetical protein IKW48_01000 [Akkermansia sp.]|nr:hypothetical protein [Akkermansia sp.]
MEQEFQAPSLRDNSEIRNYLDGITPDAPTVLPWPDFEEKAPIPSTPLPVVVRMKIRKDIITSKDEIREIYRFSATDRFFSNNGKKHLHDILRAKGDHNQQHYHTQQLIKEILVSVRETVDRCSYVANLDKWKSDYPCLESLHLPDAKALFIPPSESASIATDILNEGDISSQDAFFAAFETVFDKHLGDGPLAILQKAIEKLESI